MAGTNYIRWFRELSLTDLPLVGGKNGSLGEMFQQLAPLGVRIPDGFALTAVAYREALDAADAWLPLHRLLDKLDKRDTDALSRAAARAREIDRLRRAHAQSGRAATARGLASAAGADRA